MPRRFPLSPKKFCDSNSDKHANVVSDFEKGLSPNNTSDFNMLNVYAFDSSDEEAEHIQQSACDTSTPDS